MAAMRFAGMELGVPPAPTGLCEGLISIYKTMSYFLFDKSSPAVFDGALSRSKLKAIACAGWWALVGGALAAKLRCASFRG